jgi:replicative superfamily II helicase
MVAYGVQADLVQGLSTRSIDVFRTLSHAWHAFLGFSALHTERPSKRKREQQQQQQKQKRAKVVPTDHMEAATPSLSLPYQEASSREASLEAAVRTVLSIPADQPVTYKSADQKRALDAVVRGVSPLIVVLPTGGGKTLLPLTAAVLDRQQQRDQPSVTILVLPFRALIEDMLVRLAQAGISAVEWQPGLQEQLQRCSTLASIVLVSADYVGSSDGEFLSYAALLAQQQILRRIVIDECHTAITAASWRPKLAWLKDVRLLSCQLVLLTATLPPCQEEQLGEALLVRTATVVRAACTQRPRTQYSVVQCLRSELVEKAVEHARSLMDQAQAQAQALSAAAGAAVKGIVYCRSRQLCEQLARTLACRAYHAGSASRSEILVYDAPWYQPRFIPMRELRILLQRCVHATRIRC